MAGIQAWFIASPFGSEVRTLVLARSSPISYVKTVLTSNPRSPPPETDGRLTDRQYMILHIVIFKIDAKSGESG